jgi:hypothetical protein
MGGRFAEGAFVGEHGSWNRCVPVGYKRSIRAVPRRTACRRPDRLRIRLPEQGRQDAWPPGWSDGRSARRFDRRRRPLEHGLESYAKFTPRGRSITTRRRPILSNSLMLRGKRLAVRGYRVAESETGAAALADRTAAQNVDDRPTVDQ